MTIIKNIYDGNEFRPKLNKPFAAPSTQKIKEY